MQRSTHPSHPFPYNGYRIWRDKYTHHSFSLCPLISLHIPFGHPVSHAHLREDILGKGGGLLYLSADIRHIHPQYFVVGLGAGPSQLLHDEVIGQHPPGIFAQ